MKFLLAKISIIALILFIKILPVRANDSLSCSVSLHFYWDLSDTYGGGNLFSGEFSCVKSWFGGKLEFGHFQSDYLFLFKVPYDEPQILLQIPIHEMSFMKMGSLSGFIRPIQKKWISADLLFGAVYSRATSFYLKTIEYSYNPSDGTFDYLIKDYQLVKKSHIGYQLGIDIAFSIIKSTAIQLSSRIQDLNNGGSFFFTGAGICFKF
jgi:hypothetical protein